MVATASLMYRMGIEGGAAVRAEVSSVGTEEEKTAARAIAAADRKAERVAAVERQLQAVKQQSVEADQRALALVTGNVAAYETAKRREVAAVQSATTAHTRNSSALKSSGSAMVGVSQQVQDSFTQISMGANIFSVLAVQGGQLAGQMIYLEGTLGKVARFITSGWGLALTGGLLVLGYLTKGLFENEEAAKRAAEGMQKFQQRQSDIGNFIDATTGRLTEQNRALVLNAILTRQAQIADNNKAIAEQRNSAFRVAGNQQIRNPSTVTSSVGIPIAVRQTDPDVSRAIAAAAGDVDKLSISLANLARTSRPDLKPLALQISTQAGAAIIATRENEKLSKELRALNGDTGALVTGNTKLIESRAKLAGATSALDRAQAQYAISTTEADQAYERSKKTQADQAKLLASRTAAERALNEAQDANRKHSDRHGQSIARQSAAMVVNADASLDLARAYLTNSDAALKAEAARKGLTDATRKGIDGEAQVRRQLDIMVGEQLVTGAKAVAQLRDETAGRKAANDNVVAGRIAYAQMNRAMADEAALRPLLKLQTTAQGEALALLTQAVTAYRAALKEAHAEEARSAAQAGIADARERIAEIRASVADLNQNPIVQATNAARRAAEREADKGGYSGQDRADFIEARVLQARVEYNQRIAESYVRTRQDQEDRLALAQAELGLLGKSEVVRERELKLLELSRQMKRDGLTEDDAAYQATMARAEALEDVLVELNRQKAAMEELRSIGGDVIDTIFDPDNWKNWGDLGKRVLQDLLKDMLVLAAVNPLKNALLGTNETTMGGILGSILKLPGGSSGSGSSGGLPGTGPIITGEFPTPGNATGTLNWKGGMMIAGENGAELIDAPAGSRVYPAAETRRMLQAPARGGDTHIHQKFENSFAGNAVTMEDALLLAQAAKNGAIQAIDERQRRAP
ncbi:coiled-coil domain-containing protein [Sphingomonas hengshuiensis]|uniref:Bacteriophage tail tape measure N-terminal domain-containing protein n=1 Tax=Sphingomonas hengshuiensis TaxID=1609977 RepID=A0A7U4LFA2_9SPHN|nr:hypothetical protein [Sphingomonas hengshuiensis]AJP72267.1 hypothetical protein TS85_11410 [Sphingomonas hengshuiensis]